MTERMAADAFVKGAVETALALAGLDIPVWPDLGEDGAQPPYVVFGTGGSVGLDTNGAIHLMDEFPYTVRATFAGNVSGDADLAEAAIHDALAGPIINGVRRGIAVAEGAWFINSKRASATSSVSTPMGRSFRFVGGRFLVKVRPIS